MKNSERERERESNREENSSSSFEHFGNFILIVNYIKGIIITCNKNITKQLNNYFYVIIILLQCLRYTKLLNRP